MRRENGMLPRLKAYRRRYGGGLKRVCFVHKTQGVPDEWAFDNRKKQIFGLSNGVHKADRKFDFSGRQRPIHREHPVFCGTNHTVLTPPPYRRRYGF